MAEVQIYAAGAGGGQKRGSPKAGRAPGSPVKRPRLSAESDQRPRGLRFPPIDGAPTANGASHVSLWRSR
jgi:hypothetical protein